NFPLARSVFSWLGSDRSAAGGLVASTRTRYLAASRRSQAVARPSGSGFSSRLFLRHSLVRRNLLLDLQHHAPVWRCGYGGRPRPPASFFSFSFPLSRPLSVSFSAC